MIESKNRVEISRLTSEKRRKRRVCSARSLCTRPRPRSIFFLILRFSCFSGTPSQFATSQFFFQARHSALLDKTRPIPQRLARINCLGEAVEELGREEAEKRDEQHARRFPESEQSEFLKSEKPICAGKSIKVGRNCKIFIFHEQKYIS